MAQTRSTNPAQARGSKTTVSKATKEARKGRTSNSDKAATPAVQISSTAMATYKRVQARIEAQKKAEKDAEDAGERQLFIYMPPEFMAYIQQYVLAIKSF